MRFKLTLIVDKQAFGNRMPINYQYEQQAIIYKILAQANKEYAGQLHNITSRAFKNFCFSRFYIPSFDAEGDRLVILSDQLVWKVSFMDTHAAENFIQGISMNQTFQLGDIKSTIQFKIQNIEVLPELSYQEGMTFKTFSPMCVSRKDPDGKVTYLSPEEDVVGKILRNNLCNRYRDYYGKDFEVENFDFDFMPTKISKPRLITIKAGKPDETKIRGYMCNFKIKAPEELLYIMYNGGIGEKNSMGFGFVEEKVGKYV